MGALIGLCVGLGVVLVLAGLVPAPSGQSQRASTTSRQRQLLDQAGLHRWAPLHVWSCSFGAALVAGLAVVAVSRSSHVAAVFAAAAAYAPWAWLVARRRRRREALGHVWPDVVDDLTSAVRAGLALPEALTQLARRGPAELRGPFRRFAVEHAAGARFSDCLEHLKAELADPIGDRVVEALRLARDVGGNDLGGLLRTLSQFLRDDARVRGELTSRQAWTVNGARLAVCAPWFVLGLLATRPRAVAAYDSAAGAVVLAVGAALCLVAYRVMMRIGRLPADPRVLA